MMTIEDHIAQHAATQPEKAAIVTAGSVMTYADLQKAMAAKAQSLRNNGLRRGEAVPLRATSTAETLIDYFAIHCAGGVAVPIDKGAEPAPLPSFPVPNDAADILFTTGTTGRSKGAVVSHRAIAANAENLICGQGFTPELLFVINGPLNHIGSLSKVWPVMQVGGTISLVDGLKDFNAFFAAFDFPATKTATFLVPAAARLLLQMAPQRMAALSQRMDFIELGAAPLPRQDMLTLCHTFPNSRLYNTYASTETGIVCTYNFNDDQCIAGCTGRPMKNARVDINEEGLVVCAGSMTMSGYYGDEEATQRVMIDGAIHTADRGHMDEAGRLHLMGRNDDVINVGGFKVNPVEVEDAAMAIPLIKDCLCVADTSDGGLTTLKLLVVMADGATIDKRAIARQLAERLERHKVPTRYEQTDTIRRTFNGKPDRKAYRNG